MWQQKVYMLRIVHKSKVVSICGRVSLCRHATSSTEPAARAADVNNRTNSTRDVKITEFVDLDFDNVEEAFQTRPTKDLFRALTVLRLCSFQPLVNNSLQLMKYSKKILGKTLFTRLMKETFYGQFVAGESTQEILEAVEKLKLAGIAPMLAIPLEEDVGENTTGDREALYDQNTKMMLDCIDLEGKVTEPSQPKLMQIRISGLTQAELLVKMSKIIKKTLIDKERQLETIEKFSKNLDPHKRKSDEELLPGLTENECTQLGKTLDRLDKIGKYGAEKDVRVLMDAEYTYFNPAMTLLTLAMMHKYNRPTPYIWNTYQCYLRETYSRVTNDLDLSLAGNFGFGIKLVRGAYMVKEREVAKKEGYKDPVNENYEETNKNYNRVADKVLTVVKERGHNLMIASHNENSILLAVQKMHKLGIRPDEGTTFFGQLFGMCDHVSYELGKTGYLVYKSIPYGNVDDVMPYLYRRAVENRAILHGARRERNLLSKEFNRRKIV